MFVVCIKRPGETPQQRAYLAGVTTAFPDGLFRGFKSCRKYKTAAEAQEAIERLQRHAAAKRDQDLVEHFNQLVVSTTGAEVKFFADAGLTRLL
jgi:hypothetical protein